jgi:hypothetical protein
LFIIFGWGIPQTSLIVQHRTPVQNRRDPGSRLHRVICLHREPKPGLCSFDHARSWA